MKIYDAFKYDISMILINYYNDNINLINILNKYQDIYGKYKNEIEIILIDMCNLNIHDKIKNIDLNINYIVDNNNNICKIYNNAINIANGKIIMIQKLELCNYNVIEYILTHLTEYDCYVYNYYDCNIDIISLYKSKIDLIGGFDENFTMYYFNVLLLTVQYNLKLNIKIINDIIFHDKTNDIKINANNECEKYENMKIYHEEHKFNYPKLLHLYWDGSPLSFLNYCTILSFNEYHKYWKINIYMPNKKTDNMLWKTQEQKLTYEIKCYLETAKKTNNVCVHYMDFNNIGFYNDASEVVKSDYFRYYILQKNGGIWSDFDIVYTSCIENKMNFDEDIVLFKCKCKDKYIKQKYYYMISFLLSKFNNSFYECIKKECIKYYDKYVYQSIGTLMLNDLLKNDNFVNIHYKYNSTIKICNDTYYVPWAWDQLDEFLIKKNNTLPPNNIGIHWFNGAQQSKQYAIDLENRINNNFEIKCYLDTFIIKYIKKISIVMAYYNRKNQLIETIKTIKKSKYKNIEIIIVDDASDKNQQACDFINDINDDLDIKLITINKEEKTWVNPCIAYNKGFKIATGDIIIIQNPEVMHIKDCISYIANNLQLNDWMTLNCYGSPNYIFNESMQKLHEYTIFRTINNKKFKIGGNSVLMNDVGGWLNHYEYHFTAYHYFAAIHKKDLFEKMNGGFNETFKDNIAYDDDEFIKRLIYNKFKFKINKFIKNSPFVVHQYHEKPLSLTTHDYKINRCIFDQICISMNLVPENDIHKAPINETPKGNIYLI
jgi:glycosyltransferase involved in cell wall biosynthesis